jgi:DNA-binding PadR family transcriptional regulator
MVPTTFGTLKKEIGMDENQNPTFQFFSKFNKKMPKPPWAPPFKGGAFPWQWFGHHGPRAERGDLRYLILDAIAEEPRHGYEVMQVVEERSGGAYRPSPGVVYPTLQMLEELGHAEVKQERGRKVYSITDLGREDLGEHSDEVEAAYERVGGALWEKLATEFSSLGEDVQRLFSEVGRAAARGTLKPERMQEVRRTVQKAVDEARRILRRREDEATDKKAPGEEVDIEDCDDNDGDTPCQ